MKKFLTIAVFILALTFPVWCSLLVPPEPPTEFEKQMAAYDNVNAQVYLDSHSDDLILAGVLVLMVISLIGFFLSKSRKPGNHRIFGQGGGEGYGIPDGPLTDPYAGAEVDPNQGQRELVWLPRGYGFGYLPFRKTAGELPAPKETPIEINLGTKAEPEWHRIEK